ncbi:hypothetical protein [Kribbella sp. NPDC000426]|uniref:hypothetical protein n=1 Tax=Kribbella sp. NPDC000426 TaxID=3154255 RepID=UPI0033349333
MNTQLTPPPDHDLRPATRSRQRDELIAIIDHESAQGAPRRRLVPLAAAAAVVAVTAGLAIGVPALRGDKAQPPASGAGVGAATPPLEPLSTAEQNRYAKACNGNAAAIPDPAARGYTVLDGFKWVNPPAGTTALAWIVIKKHSKDMAAACGFDAKGKQTAFAWGINGETKMDVVDGGSTGGGTYTKSVARVTIAFGTGPATEAVLRKGFFFAPMKYVDTLTRPAPTDPLTYTVRGYDAAGKLIYASPKTYRELNAKLDGCFTNPEGTKVVYVGGGRKGTPPVSQCRRGVAWNW